MVLNDRQIKEYVEKYRMIEPFVDKQVQEGVVSYGLSSYGYDIRIADEFLIFKMTQREPLITPKAFNPDYVTRVKKDGDPLILKPGQYALGKSVEYIRMPRDLIAICVNKSTYARCGLIVNVSPIEATWEGYLTIELANPTQYRIAIYPNEGIAQLIFLKGEPCEISYADKKGKYQEQKDITLPKIK